MESYPLVKSKKELAILLSKVKPFENPKFELEQYFTPSEIASELLWKAFLDGNVYEKTIVDIGAGTGILGIGALLLGAEKVYFVEKDKEAVKILEENLENFKIDQDRYEILNIDFEEFNLKVNTLISNPPFGRQSKEDKKFFRFLKRTLASNIYLIWEEGRIKLLQKTLSDIYKLEIFSKVKFPIKPTMKFHTKRKHYFNALLIYGKLRL